CLCMMNVPRHEAAAITLNTGKVLVIGGDNSLLMGGFAGDSAEVFDPAMATFAPTGAPDFSADRMSSGADITTATGKVLVTGGVGFGNNFAQLFDPGTNQWTLTAPMNGARQRHTETTLADGKTVLVAGGVS